MKSVHIVSEMVSNNNLGLCGLHSSKKTRSSGRKYFAYVPYIV